MNKKTLIIPAILGLLVGCGPSSKDYQFSILENQNYSLLNEFSSINVGLESEQIDTETETSKLIKSFIEFNASKTRQIRQVDFGYGGEIEHSSYSLDTSSVQIKYSEMKIGHPINYILSIGDNTDEYNYNTGKKIKHHSNYPLTEKIQETTIIDFDFNSANLIAIRSGILGSVYDYEANSTTHRFYLSKQDSSITYSLLSSEQVIKTYHLTTSAGNFEKPEVSSWSFY